MAEETKLIPEMPKLDMPQKMPESFEEASDMTVKLLAPVEEISPFKLGQVQKLIEDMHEPTGKAVAPAFAIGQVFFLIFFFAYLIYGVVVLCLDSGAIDCPCAEDSWIWLFALLVLTVPTFFGSIMGCVKAGLKAASLEDKVPDVLISLPSPLIMVTLGVLGIILWAGMEESCDSFYSESHAQLLVLFRIQVILMGVASIFGFITLWAQAVAAFNKYSPIGDKPEEGKAV
eukprot:CAMPEP_0184289820 /NCGR_PEP_ID=MMETSP1049-20130417/2190_1 /TAXON_ID=77928 /ORGANISM="Proteomonas sulcata, Strain CCMP704" /LENGTH=229 /DNA_ID=CAMNT_0026596759 /DNA_START=11 /DNA_END=700 /DNA_ORIENTATION=-